MRAPVDDVPLVALAPDHPPEALHEVAPDEDQVNVDAAPLATLAGLARSETLGAAADTVTVTDCDALPPLPVQLREYVSLAVRAPVEDVPLVDLEPDQPPDAVQALASVDDQVSADAAPLFTVLGVADSVIAGTGLVTDTVADCVAVPPVPVHVKL